MKYYLAVFLLAMAVFVSQTKGNPDPSAHRNLVLFLYDLSLESTLAGLTMARDDAWSFRDTTKGISIRRCELWNQDQENVPVKEPVRHHQSLFYIPFNTLHEQATQRINEGNQLAKNITAAIESCNSERQFDNCFEPKANIFAGIKHNFEQNSQRILWNIYAAKKELFRDPY